MPSPSLSPASPSKKRRSTKPRREELKPGECLCDHCTGRCCRYFTVPLDPPKSWDDYDTIRWYLAHGNTIVYVDKDGWYLLVMTKCKYLTRDDRCSVYLNRPKVCRDYTTDECEYDSVWGFEKVFESAEQIWEYAEAILPPRRRPAATAPAGALAILMS